MELVGVRNIEISIDNNEGVLADDFQFEVDSNLIFKISSVSIGMDSYSPSLNTRVPQNPEAFDFRVNLNGGNIYYYDREPSIVEQFPIFLEYGSHVIDYYLQSSGFRYTIILYGQEFKLTTP